MFPGTKILVPQHIAQTNIQIPTMDMLVPLLCLPRKESREDKGERTILWEKKLQ